MTNLFADTTARALEHRVRAEQRSARVPSLSVGVARAGRHWWCGVGSITARPDGPAPTPDTQYRMGSISKTFVAALVLRLVQDGLLGLDDELEQHLPDTGIGQVSIAQLLSHTSGLAAETVGPWWERTAGGSFADLGPSLRLVFAPGERFHYSNVGFAVLGEVVARLRGRPWDDVLREELLEPLRLDATTAAPRAPHAPGLGVHPRADVLQPEPAHDAGAMAPAGQLWSTPSDLLVWAAVLRGDNNAVLTPDTARLMRRPRGLHDEPGLPWTAAHGLGVEVSNRDGRRYIGHGGSMPGFLAGLAVDVETGDAAVALANATSGARMSALVLDLLAIVSDLEPAPPEPWFADPAQPGHLDLVGEWFWGTAAHHLGVTADGGLVLSTTGPGRPDRFMPDGVDLWCGQDGYFAGETLRVVRPAAGSGQTVHLEIASFRFTREPYEPTADVPGGTLPWT